MVSAEEEQSYVDFEKSTNNSRARINVMLEQNRAFQLYYILHLEITDWEESDITSLTRTFPKQYPDIQRRLAEYRSSSCTSGGYRLPILQAHSKNLRKRLTKLIELATQDTPDSAPTTEFRDVSEDSYRRDKKARIVPLGDLADWSSFWRRFQDYVGKLCHIMDDERLNYLLDCLKDPTTQDIVADSIRNGVSFEEVEKRLQRKYDKPTPPLSHSHTQAIRRNEQDQQILAKRGKWPEFHEGKPPAEDLSLRYSSISKFRNVVSWRFCSNTTKPQAERVLSFPLIHQEINAAEIWLYKQQQAKFFSKEQIALTSGTAVSSSSSIYLLQPIFDSERLIRVGESVSHSDLLYSQQHSIILHRNAHLTKLLVQHLHLLHPHAGPTLLLGTLSHKYYVVGVFNSTGQG